jgi:SnoaL-like polyketide cyclase
VSNSTVGDAAIAVVRRNTEEVQGKGNWRVFEELFADDFVDHTPQPGTTPDKDGVRVLYKRLRAAFPDFRPEIHWQVAAGDLVTTYKTYHGTHQGEFLGIPATGRRSASTPSTPCESSTERSPSIGASRRCST